MMGNRPTLSRLFWPATNTYVGDPAVACGSGDAGQASSQAQPSRKDAAAVADTETKRREESLVMTEKEVQFENRIDGIHFLVIAGMPGSGLSAIGQEVHDRLAKQGFAVANVADNDLHEPSLSCAACSQRSA